MLVGTSQKPNKLLLGTLNFLGDDNRFQINDCSWSLNQSSESEPCPSSQFQTEVLARTCYVFSMKYQVIFSFAN